MKKRDLLSFVLMGNLALNSFGAGNPEFHVEKDPHKFIPKDAYYVLVADNCTLENKYKFSVYWYNPNYKEISDYQNVMILPDDEMFVDIDGDGIPDMTLPDVRRAYREMKERDSKLKIIPGI